MYWQTYLCKLIFIFQVTGFKFHISNFFIYKDHVPETFPANFAYKFKAEAVQVLIKEKPTEI